MSRSVVALGLVMSALAAAPSARGQVPTSPPSTAGTPRPSGATIGNGKYSVKLDRNGLLVGAPDGGMTAGYGPRVVFDNATTEWWSVAYDTPSGRVSAVGEALAPDYAKRTPVQFVSFTQTSESAVSVTKVGDLEIEHTFSFDDVTGCLIVGVILHNTGTTPMNMVMYSRDWRRPKLKGGTFPADWTKDLPPAPGDVWRMAWMPNNIAPGTTQGAVLALQPPSAIVKPRTVEVPLELWKGGSFPNGLDFGGTYGITIGDYDHDGWIDVFACSSRNLWRNLNGTDWQLVANLDDLFTASFNYSAAIADYDDDNLPDIGTEPRGDCMDLLHNLGSTTFKNVATDPSIVDVRPCNAESETMCVADVDGDGHLDWFLPTYPPELGSSGNWFLYNKGPDASGVYSFHEASAEAGLDNPPYPSINRPEGAMFCDVDADGDVDLYSNNTIYRNVSTPGTPLFETMTASGSGVVFASTLDEGAAFLDYDMDGDMDLVIAFCDSVKGVRMFENWGDGTFSVKAKTFFDSPDTGLCLGLSAEDWDNDGDVDVTTAGVFRRNQWQESKSRHYTVATTDVDPAHATSATPAWGDWDRDGDLDCVLGNWGEEGRLYENVLYDANTPAKDRRYVRVRVVRDSDQFDDGLETEYGAQVTVFPSNTPYDTQRRVRVVSTSNGYLNQNEYTLHFALPADPDPADDSVDVHFSVKVDFKGASSQGTHRVDKHVNPVLGEIDLARLENREITVYRSGRVKIDGCDFQPALPMNSLTTTHGGLVLAGTSTALAAPTTSPAADWFVGTEISTVGLIEPQLVEEIVLDGNLDAAVDCGGDTANLYAWDVTDPANPELAAGGLKSGSTRLANRRSYLNANITLEPGRVYRIVARMTSYRTTPIAAPITDAGVTTNGGLFFQDSSPCSGAAVAAATVDPSNAYLALRFRPAPSGAWADLGQGLAGSNGVPKLEGVGTLRGGEDVTATMTSALPNAPMYLVVGGETDCLPFAKGVIVPALEVVFVDFVTDSNGGFSVTDTWPLDVASGSTFYMQAIVFDDGAAKGLAYSNAVAGTAPF